MSKIQWLSKLGFLRSGIGRLYHEIRQDDKSFKQQWQRDILNDHINGQSLEEIAVHYGISDEFEHYLQTDFNSMRGHTARAYNLLSILKDTIDDALAAGILTAEMVSAIPTGGSSIAALEAAEIPLEAVVQLTYNVLATGLGVASGTYTFHKKGAARYVNDLGLSNLDALIKMGPLVDKIIELGTHMGDPRDSIISASSSRAKYWLVQRARQIDPMALSHIEKEKDLVDIIQSAPGRFQGVRSGLVDYKDTVKGYVSSLYDVMRPKKQVYQTVGAG